MDDLITDSTGSVADSVRFIVNLWALNNGREKHVVNLDDSVVRKVYPSGAFYNDFFNFNVDELVFYTESLERDDGDTIKTAWRIVREFLYNYGCRGGSSGGDKEGTDRV